jgi:hypothetical protein
LSFFFFAVLVGLRFTSSHRHSPESITINTPQLISTFLFGSTDPKHYSMTDGIVREDKKTNLGDAIKLAENDPIWALRGKAIQSYAILEQALCGVSPIDERLLRLRRGHKFDNAFSSVIDAKDPLVLARADCPECASLVGSERLHLHERILCG